MSNCGLSSVSSGSTSIILRVKLNPALKFAAVKSILVIALGTSNSTSINCLDKKFCGILILKKSWELFKIVVLPATAVCNKTGLPVTPFNESQWLSSVVVTNLIKITWEDKLKSVGMLGMNVNSKTHRAYLDS